jgi:hypothetical protein
MAPGFEHFAGQFGEMSGLGGGKVVGLFSLHGAFVGAGFDLIGSRFHAVWQASYAAKEYWQSEFHFRGSTFMKCGMRSSELRQCRGLAARWEYVRNER